MWFQLKNLIYTKMVNGLQFVDQYRTVVFSDPFIIFIQNILFLSFQLHNNNIVQCSILKKELFYF
jgi:hypothetical protein